MTRHTKKSRITYYDPKPPSRIHFCQTYKTNKTTVDAYVREHLARDVGGFFKAVALAVLWEKAGHDKIGPYAALPSTPIVYKHLLHNLHFERPPIGNIMWSYHMIPRNIKPTRILAYLKDREYGWTQ